jgi:hypothetical protein
MTILSAATLLLEGGRAEFPVVRQRDFTLLLAGEPPPDNPVHIALDLQGIPRGAVTAVAQLARVASPAAAPMFAARMIRIDSSAGAPALKETLRACFGVEHRTLPANQTEHLANYWSVACDPQHPMSRFPRLPPLGLAEVKLYFHRNGAPSVLNLYPNLGAVFVANGIPQAGKLIRLNESVFLVRTNGVLPPLGNPVFVQLALSTPLRTRYCVLRGIVSRRSDDRAESTFKGRFEGKTQEVEEIEYPGTFMALLEAAARAPTSADEPDPAAPVSL